ncbi:ABC transporter permease [Hoyosella rhizosphaerae]|uniref:ABC transporter permease n=1 Tax=Hoyosella rhizosphaerae TaxID=1755582 RepID=A0A916U1R7_9ACTN|nr:ABC transporter permease [Hoyosella rhizosphaerae]MBN4926748.1 ABC transporter permease [Hoyosella rhizosphaerae]GGC56791.1 ABC transporter permease [Hoyosella rhizosphaerae]
MTTLWFYLTDFFANPDSWTGTNGIPNRMFEHFTYTILALIVAIAIAFPLGLWTGHTGRGGFLLSTLANAARALPTYGVLVLLVVTMGMGLVPVLIPLVALAIPPILLNTYEGIRSIDRALPDAARGMGMSGLQVLVKAELPVAMPLILVGMRTAAVQIVATATIAAAVSFGGVGRLIVDGLARRDFTLVVGGGVLAAFAALLILAVFAVLQRVLISDGLRDR